ncbi:MAG: rod shape-determining protein RodA [Imperialibacter sp.]
MRTRRLSLTSNQFDWLAVSLYFLLVLLGWLNIYAAVYDDELGASIFDFSINSGRQLIWISTSVLIILVISIIDFRFYDSFAFIVLGVIVVMLVSVLIFGSEVKGSKSWFGIGAFGIQPSEFAKFATALALAKFLSQPTIKFEKISTQLMSLGIIAVPAALILLQGDTGTAMVFACFIIVLYREGLSPVFFMIGFAFVLLFILTLLVNKLVLIIGLLTLGLLAAALSGRNIKKIGVVIVSTVFMFGFVQSVDFIMNKVLKPHQQKRVMQLIDPNADPLGAGWQVTQSKIAIGSGGLFGKGYLQGTQTKFDFVPDQSTDNIFCTVGEEHGWFGGLILIAAFLALLLRITQLAERQKSKFARVYGYGVASIMFFHFAFNIAMTIGLFPVIGIPLPFFSYGGSSLWAFTILLFIFLKLDAHRMQIFTRS